MTGADWKIWPEDVAEIVRMLLLMPARTLVSRVEVRPAKAEEIRMNAGESEPESGGASKEMVLGLPESLWKGEPKVGFLEKEGGGQNGTAQHPVGSRKDRTRCDTTGERPTSHDCRAGRGDRADCQYLSDAPYRDEPSGTAHREFSVPGTHRFRQDPYRRSHRRGDVEEPARGNQDRLRRVPAQPRNRQADRLASGISGTSRDASAAFAGSAESVSTPRRCKLSFVLFDEIEKASDALWNLLLGILDKGYADAGRQPQSGFLPRHDLHDQQPGRDRDERPDGSQAGLRRGRRYGKDDHAARWTKR